MLQSPLSFYLTLHSPLWHCLSFSRNLQKNMDISLSCCGFSFLFPKCFPPRMNFTPHLVHSVSDIYHWQSLPWDAIHINEWALFWSWTLLRFYLNLVNAAFQLFSAPGASAPALCWHSSNPLLGGDCIPCFTALRLYQRGRIKARGSICDRICGEYGHTV